MALDLLIITAAVLGLIGTGIGFPFLLVSELGNILFVIGGGGAIVAGGVAVTCCNISRGNCIWSNDTNYDVNCFSKKRLLNPF